MECREAIPEIVECARARFEPGAALTRLYPSGAAAVAAALLSVLSAGDELLMTDSAYGPTRAFCDTMLKRFGVTTIYYDPLVGAGIAALFTDKTRAIFLESPGTHTFEVFPEPEGCRLEHRVEIVPAGLSRLGWPLIFGPLHDALAEDAVDNAVRVLGEAREPNQWSVYVRALRGFANLFGR